VFPRENICVILWMVHDCILLFSIFHILSISCISRKSVTKYSINLKEFNLYRYITILFIRFVVTNCSSGISTKVYRSLKPFGIDIILLIDVPFRFNLSNVFIYICKVTHYIFIFKLNDN
jgi:hypothetical protein